MKRYYVERYYAKGINLRHFIGRMKNSLRPARALRAWRHAQALRLRQIATPLNLAVLAARRGVKRGASYLLTEDLEDAQLIDRYLLKSLNGVRTPSLLHRKRAFIHHFAVFVRTLHQRGVYHHDVKADNLLVRDLPAEPPRFILLDLARVSFPNRLSRRKRQRNLLQITTSFLDRRVVTQTDRWRFLRTYLRHESGGRSICKAWWKAIERASSPQFQTTKRARPPGELSSR